MSKNEGVGHISENDRKYVLDLLKLEKEGKISKIEALKKFSEWIEENEKSPIKQY